MANKTEKKSTAKKANAKENFSPKTFMEVIAGHINSKALQRRTRCFACKGT